MKTKRNRRLKKSNTLRTTYMDYMAFWLLASRVTIKSGSVSLPAYSGPGKDPEEAHTWDLFLIMWTAVCQGALPITEAFHGKWRVLLLIDDCPRPRAGTPQKPPDPCRIMLRN
ncbi:hypothetical protein CEXT_195191 [Caerostris extrusa]|uniref:Uncharacterized protein n=1 Tax=Caerostris extrusa TaxID=172846 RepID=A0AAV4M6N7_CAEEX|nr:hypothetical protein CEXT_195191 [Caerostris extrusa]